MSIITVRFFASLREALGDDHLEVPADEAPSLARLVDWLETSLGDAARVILSEPDVLVAINQTMIPADNRANHQLAPGDEVAFLPPVTGG